MEILAISISIVSLAIILYLVVTKKYVGPMGAVGPRGPMGDRGQKGEYAPILDREDVKKKILELTYTKDSDILGWVTSILNTGPLTGDAVLYLHSVRDKIHKGQKMEMAMFIDRNTTKTVPLNVFKDMKIDGVKACFDLYYEVKDIRIGDIDTIGEGFIKLLGNPFPISVKESQEEIIKRIDICLGR